MDRALRFVRRLPAALLLLGKRFCRAWRYYRRLKYSWHVSWMKAGYGSQFDEHRNVTLAGML
jgi:hypothetical protein